MGKFFGKVEIPLQYNGRSLLCGGRWRPVRTLFPFLFLFLGERRTGRRGKTGEGIGEFSIVTKRGQEKGRNTFDPPHMWVNTKSLSLREGQNNISPYRRERSIAATGTIWYKI